MGNTHNTLKENLKYFADLNRYAIQILEKLSESVYTENETVTIQVKNSKGDIIDYDIPSFYSQNRKISSLENEVKYIYDKKLLESGNEIEGNISVNEPKEIQSIDIPTSFNSKHNWIFETLLDPLLYITVDVSEYVNRRATQIVKRRILLDLDTEDKNIFFDENLKDKNDIDFDELMKYLEEENISFSIDDDVLNLPPSKLKFSGKFDVISIDSDSVSSPKYESAKWYTLNKLSYIDTYTGNESRALKIGDLLSANLDTVYEVIDVDNDKDKVLLGFKYGNKTVSVGVDVFRIMSPVESKKDFQIPISVNEKQVIFLKPVDPYSNTTTLSWGDGFSFDSNSLTIIDNELGEIGLEDYYNSKVRDFGKLFLNASDSVLLHGKYGQMFNEKIKLNADDAKIVTINDYVMDHARPIEEDELTDMLKRIKASEVECKDVNESINDITVKLKDSSLSNEDKEELQSKLNELLTRKESCNKIMETSRNEIINTYEKIKDNGNVEPKYRIQLPWTDEWYKTLEEELIRIQNLKDEQIDIFTSELYDKVFYEVRYRYITNSDKTGTRSVTVTNLLGDDEKFDYDNGNYIIVHNRRDVNGNIIPNNLAMIPIRPHELVEIEIRAVIDIDIIGRYQTPWSERVVVDSINYKDFYKMKSETLLSQLEKEYTKSILERDYALNSMNTESMLKMINDLSDKVSMLLSNIIELYSETITIDTTMITNKEFFLNKLPSDINQIQIFVDGGTKGIVGDDFIIKISGYKITWDGYDWDGILEEGDKLNIIYPTVKII